jgi:nucleotide-binding universal stress UspA family protein
VTLVVGLAPDGHGRAVLHLAGMLARTDGQDVVLCAVIPAAWFPSPARVDAEYRAYVNQAAEDALAKARARLATDIRATCVVRHARSTPAGLLEVAEEHDAALIVAGSAQSGGSGYVSVGSVTSRLLHSSPIPVALAPRGFRCRPDARVTRVTAAFGGAAGSAAADDLVIAAAGFAARTGATLRIASFAVMARPPYTVAAAREARDAMVDEWAAETEAAVQPVMEEVEDLPAAPPGVDAVVGYGESWDEALEDVEWDDGDVLVVGSSSTAPLERVFLGARATKIVRHSPVPVVVVPRGAAAELAEEAARADAAGG